MSPKLYESLHIWNTESTPDNVSRNGARHTLRTVWFRGHGRRSARHVATNPLRFCSFAKTTSSSANEKQCETIVNMWQNGSRGKTSTTRRRNIYGTFVPKLKSS